MSAIDDAPYCISRCLQDNAAKLLTKVRKWRGQMLSLSGLAAQADAGAASSVDVPGCHPQAVNTSAAGRKGKSEVVCEGAVAKAYSLYSVMDARATCFGMTLQCLLQMCHDMQLYDDK